MTVGQNRVLDCQRRECLVSHYFWTSEVWAIHCTKGEWVSPIQPNLLKYFCDKVVRGGIFELRIGPKKLFSRLFIPVSLKELDLHNTTYRNWIKKFLFEKCSRKFYLKRTFWFESKMKSKMKLDSEHYLTCYTWNKVNTNWRQKYFF